MKAARRAIFAVAIVAVVCVGLGVGVMASTTLSPQLGGSAPPPLRPNSSNLGRLLCFG